MKSLKFTKMVATGNDFIVIDNSSSHIAYRISHIAYRISHIAKRLCDRKTGIGADGLLLLEKSKAADFKMRILNPDGSEPDMCGNGSRCAALYAKLKRMVSSKMAIETRAGILSAKVIGKSVKINMTEPKGLKTDIIIKLSNKSYKLNYINTGVPHAIYFVGNIDKVDVFNLGRKIRQHNVFMPDGANVDFIQIKGRNSIFMRTYERGVEDETLACGTGAVASAIVTSVMKGYNSPVKVYTRGGVLNIYFNSDRKNKISNVFLEGEAREVFTGEIKVSRLACVRVNPLIR
ncbi:MAG: diaminopimelate epimerase [Candidatus Omnitrophota bacterium]